MRSIDKNSDLPNEMKRKAPKVGAAELAEELIIIGKRQRALPPNVVAVNEWFDEHFEKSDEKFDYHLPKLYDTCSNMLRETVKLLMDYDDFKRLLQTKFHGQFRVKEESPLKKRKLEKQAKPKAQDSPKWRDFITEVCKKFGNPLEGVNYRNLVKEITNLRVDVAPEVVARRVFLVINNMVYHGKLENVRGVGRLGYYRLPGDETAEKQAERQEQEEKLKKELAERREAKKKAKEEKETNGAKKSSDKKKTTKKRRSTLTMKSKKKKVDEPRERRLPLDSYFPLAITYQSDPKVASVKKITEYVQRYYDRDISADQVRRTLERHCGGEGEAGLWSWVTSQSVELDCAEFDPERDLTLSDRIICALVATHEPKQCSATLLRNYIMSYHSDLFDIANKPHLFKTAVERALRKGTIRQVSGVGAGGTFSLPAQYVPSPRGLVSHTSPHGDTSDEDVTDSDDDDDGGGAEYVPRPTASRRRPGGQPSGGRRRR